MHDGRCNPPHLELTVRCHSEFCIEHMSNAQPGNGDNNPKIISQPITCHRSLSRWIQIIRPRLTLVRSQRSFLPVQVIFRQLPRYRWSGLECISQKYKGYLFVGARKWRLNGIHAEQFKFRLSVIQTSKEGWLLWIYRGVNSITKLILLKSFSNITFEWPKNSSLARVQPVQPVG